MMENFAVFIISHGRPKDIPTIKNLKKSGYTGKIYIIVDDQDKCLDEYKQCYGDSVIVFNKQYYIENAVSFSCEPLVNVAVHARNASEDIAKELGLEYFLLLDDDIVNFQFKFTTDNKLNRIRAFDLDDIFHLYINYMENSNIATIGIANAGYFLGGNVLAFTKPSYSKFRLLSNAFLRKVSCEVKWAPDMCEDFITSIIENRKGNIWISLPFVSCDCRIQGMNKKKVDGGNSNVYIENGNYGVAIYSVLNLPDCYKLTFNDEKLWFKCVNYDLTVPKIISHNYKKDIS